MERIEMTTPTTPGESAATVEGLMALVKYAVQQGSGAWYRTGADIEAYARRLSQPCGAEPVAAPEFREATWGVNSVMRPCTSMAVSEHAFRQWAKDAGIALTDDATPPFASGGPEFDRDTDGELLIDWSPGEGRMLTLSLRADGKSGWDSPYARAIRQIERPYTADELRIKVDSGEYGAEMLLQHAMRIIDAAGAGGGKWRCSLEQNGHPRCKRQCAICDDGVRVTQPAHSKSEYKRRVAQGDPNVAAPARGRPVIEVEEKATGELVTRCVFQEEVRARLKGSS